MYVTRGGVRLYYQVTGSGGRDLFLLPQCQPVTYSRQWKNQVPYLSRYFRVTTMDLRGNGRSDRPATGYDLDTRYQDLSPCSRRRCGRPSPWWPISCAGMLAFRYAVEHPDALPPRPPGRPVLRVGAPAVRGEGGAGDPGRLRRLARSGCSPGACPSRIRSRASRTASPGRRDDAGDPRGVAPSHRRVERLRSARRVQRPDARPPRHRRTRSCRTRTPRSSPRRFPARAWSPSRGRPRPPRPARGQGEPPHPRLRPGPAGGVAPIPPTTERTGRRGRRRRRAGPSQRRCSGSRAPSASATSSATSPSPGAARDPPGRHGGLPRRRSRRPRGRGAWGERLHPATRLLAERERALRGLGARSRAARLQRALGHGRDHGRQLHDVRRRRGARGATTSGSATRAGTSTTSCTRTPS